MSTTCYINGSWRYACFVAQFDVAKFQWRWVLFKDAAAESSISYDICNTSIPPRWGKGKRQDHKWRNSGPWRKFAPNRPNSIMAQTQQHSVSLHSVFQVFHSHKHPKLTWRRYASILHHYCQVPSSPLQGKMDSLQDILISLTPPISTCSHQVSYWHSSLSRYVCI